MERMDHVFIIAGFVILTCAKEENVSWVEMAIHRNSVHAADFNITTTSTNVGCIALCTSTPGCRYVTFTYGSSTCTRHNQLQGKQAQPNSRVWESNKEPQCNVPFAYNTNIGSCIYFSSNRRKWEDAKLDCESRQSRLLVADTPTKYTEVQSTYSSQWLFWVGGYPRTSDGQWVWLTGDLVDLTMFHPGQPSGGPGGLAFWKNRGILRLDDTFPNERHPYICELL